MNASEFIDGMRDCKHGREADPNRGEDYHRGYSAQYTAEQNVTNLSTQQNEAIYGTNG